MACEVGEGVRADGKASLQLPPLFLMPEPRVPPLFLSGEVLADEEAEEEEEDEGDIPEFDIVVENEPEADGGIVGSCLLLLGECVGV